MYTLKSRQISLCDNYDVIVVGGGPSGCTAAAAAAREGSRTLLIEGTGSLGGMGTNGLVPAWCPFSDKEKSVYLGLAEKVFNRSKEATLHVAKDELDWVPIDSEALRRIYDDLETEYGVDVLFNTVLSCVDADEQGQVNAVIVSNKDGLTAYQAKVFVDCTGDADLAVWAGNGYFLGDSNGRTMSSTHCFLLANVNLYAYLYHPQYGRAHGGIQAENKNSFVHRLPEDDRFPLLIDTHLCNHMVGPGTVGFNAGHIYHVNATHTDSVSKALVTGRKIAAQYLSALAAYFPEAFADAYLVTTGPALGIRESRRIQGDYILTVEDYISRASFEDEICRNSYYLDIHYQKEEREKIRAKGISAEEQCKHYGPGESHGIPYRSLLPDKLKNVLVAGRSISCDKLIQGSIRVMPVCLAMGEAAGMAASHAAAGNANVHEVDVKQLRRRLAEEGAYLP